jgi:transposase InsO family protein
VQSAVDYRREFVLLAIQPDANIRALCRRYHYAPATAYKWIRRYREGGLAALEDRSRRPHTSPTRTDPALEARIVAQRDTTGWNARTLHHWLRNAGVVAPPAPSTITAILHRHDRIRAEPPPPRPFIRFEHPTPNDLWQLDFMGHRPLVRGRVHPLTLLDDHSRFGLVLAACANQQEPTVWPVLTDAFARYGLPLAVLCDNGPPWGTSGAGGLTALEVWLIRLGIRVIHGRAYHPQTQGKLERWHRTIGSRVFGPARLPDLTAAQVAFDRFRDEYNTARPHLSLAGAVPISRYQPSPRPFPDRLPEIVYDENATVVRVRQKGEITFQHRQVFISGGLAGQPVGVEPTPTEGVFVVRFCQQPVATIDLRQSP